MKALAIIGGIIAVIGIYWFSTYSSLVAGDEAVKKGWGQVQNVYARRADLIPNLVNTVQGYATHEKAVFTNVTEARSKVGSIQLDMSKVLDDPAKMADLQAKFMQAQGTLSQALKSLLMVTENYPTLKADRGFLELQSQLEGTENRCTVERGRWNASIEPFNVLVRGPFSGIVAKIHGFTVKPYFEADATAQKAPVVKF